MDRTYRNCEMTTINANRIPRPLTFEEALGADSQIIQLHSVPAENAR